jgi:adenylate cyclase
MVDFVGSTRYLIDTGPQELEELVDLLFEGAQWATAQRRARVVKYVGDGVFLGGPDVAEMAEVALDLVGLLEAGSPLRARGGITLGSVVQRAGDIFGLPVNRAQVLTKATRPGTVIADETAAAALPAALRARPRTIVLPHPALGRATVVTVRRK